MNEVRFPKDPGSVKTRAEPDNNSINKSHAGKLKNEASSAEAMRKKFRTGKKDISETKEELKKRKKLQKQGRKKIYKDVAVSRTVHSQVSSSNEDDNAGVDAINAATELFEDSCYAARLKAFDDKSKDGYSGKLHGRTGKKDVTDTLKEAQKNLMKKEIQRQAIKAQAAENANAFGNVSKRFVDKAEDIAGKIAEAVREFLEEHPEVVITAFLILIVVLVLTGTLSSCSLMAGCGDDVVVGTSFTSSDADIAHVESGYVSLESGLRSKIDNIESEYPGFDEYNYSLSEISHDPFELAALLTVLYEDYTESEANEKLQTIFDQQYTLTVDEVVEIRTRTYTDDDGDEYEEDYEYYILNVKLKNDGIRKAVDAMGLTEDQLRRYQIILDLKGNKPDIFGVTPYTAGTVPEEYSSYAPPGEYLTDTQFAKMINEAKKYLGYPYVWGGSTPETSFDCSGFVSWVINHCGNGWSYGRLTANEWKNATSRVREDNVKPGDLVFFQGTYNTSGASHVGIVVDPVNKIMIHCGKPVQYTSYNTDYWRAHFYCYGRIR